MGRDLVPVILATLAWGDKWLAGAAGPPAIPLHHGHECRADIVCSTCGAAIDAGDVTAAVGPGGAQGPGTMLVGTRMARA